MAWYRDVPSPRPFFQPLYSLHNGDFQVRDTWGWCGGRAGGARLSGLPRMWASGEAWGPLSVLGAFSVYIA